MAHRRTILDGWLCPVCQSVWKRQGEQAARDVVLYLLIACVLFRDENFLLTVRLLRQGWEYSEGIEGTLSRCSEERSAPLTDAR